MYTLKIEKLLHNFNVTEEDIQLRYKLDEKLPMISKILIEKFYKQYLQNDKEVSSYFKYINMDFILTRLKEFIIFIYSAPLNQDYIEEISKVGKIHADIKLNNAKVKYAFFGLNQLLYDISKVEPLIKNNFKSLSKFLAMTEYIIIESTNFSINKLSANISPNSPLWTIDKLNSLLLMHKVNYNKVENNINGNTQDTIAIDSIKDDPLKCEFHNFIENIKQEPGFKKVIQIDFNEIEHLHIQWHVCIKNIKKAIKNNNIDKQNKNFKELTHITNKLTKLIDQPIKKFSTNGFLALNAGLKTITFINFLFSNRNMILNSELDIQDNVIHTVLQNIQTAFAGTLKNTQVQTQELNNKDYDIIKKIKYKEHTFYIGILLQTLPNKFYLERTLHLLLEALELHFSIKEREFTLIEYAEKAESANRSKDVFLSSISHELRTPLTAVNGYSEILMYRKDTPENIKSYLKKINIAGNNLLALVNTILVFARLEAGKMKFNPTLNSVYLLLQEVEILSIPMAHKKNITLNLLIDLRIHLVFDLKLVKQVLLNLISNAIKFTPERGTVTLTLSYDEERKGYKFSVCDNGIGISESNQKKLFHSFTQIDNIYQKSVSGSGLGLMICKKIIEELHNGHIWVESEEDNGSCFHVLFPTKDPATITYSINKAPKGSKRLLIVEDNPTDRELMQSYLENKFALTFTNTNNGAKNILNAETFDMVLLDFYLEDGISSEITRYMEDENINIPTVILSNENEVTVAEQIHVNNNIDIILSKKDLKEFCAILNPELNITMPT